MHTTKLISIIAPFLLILGGCGSSEDTLGKKGVSLTAIEGQATLGQISNGTVKVYRLDGMSLLNSNEVKTVAFDESMLTEDNKLAEESKVGTFSAKFNVPKNMTGEELVMIVVNGGTDINPNDDEYIALDEFKPLTGSILAITTLKELKAGHVVVNAVSTLIASALEISPNATNLNLSKIKEDLTVLASFVLSDVENLSGFEADLNNDGKVDFKDVALLNPVSFIVDNGITKRTIDMQLSTENLYPSLLKDDGYIEFLSSNTFESADYKKKALELFPDNEGESGDGIIDVLGDKDPQDLAVNQLVNLVATSVEGISLTSQQINFFTRSMLAVNGYDEFYTDFISRITDYSDMEKARASVKEAIIKANVKLPYFIKLKQTPREVSVNDFLLMGVENVDENNLEFVVNRVLTINNLTLLSQVQDEVNNVLKWATSPPHFTIDSSVSYDTLSVGKVITVTALDSDVDDQVLFSLTPSQPPLFTINKITGDLHFLSPPVFKEFVPGQSNPNQYIANIIATDNSGNVVEHALTVDVINYTAILNKINLAIADDAKADELAYSDFLGINSFKYNELFLAFVIDIIKRKDSDFESFEKFNEMLLSLSKVFDLVGSDTGEQLTREEYLNIGFDLTQDSLALMNQKVMNHQGDVTLALLEEMTESANNPSVLINGAAALGSISGGDVSIYRFADSTSLLSEPVKTVLFTSSMIDDSTSLADVGNFQASITVPQGMSDDELIKIEVTGGVDINPNEDSLVVGSEAVPLVGKMVAFTTLEEIKTGNVVVNALSTFAGVLATQSKYEQTQEVIKNNLSKIAKFLLSNEAFFLTKRGDINFDGYVDFKDLALYDPRKIEAGKRADDRFLSSKNTYEKILFNNNDARFIGDSFIRTILEQEAGAEDYLNQAKQLFSDTDSDNNIDLLQANNEQIIAVTKNYISLMMANPALSSVGSERLNLLIGQYIAKDGFNDYYSQKIRNCTFLDNDNITIQELSTCIKQANLNIDVFHKVVNQGMGAVEDFENLGVYGVTADNLIFVLAELSKTSELNTVSKIQEAVLRVVSWAVNTPVIGSPVDVSFSASTDTGVVYTATATDPDENDSITFTLSADEDFKGNHFTINPTTGELEFKVAPNYHDPLVDDNANNLYEVRIHAVDKSGNIGTKDIVVEVVS